ncbi:MAG: hypothetical protein ABSG28_03390 [Methanoregula sp.]|jgi:tetratricopeptide (TPR) repeat protein|uniref:hypothetical protein n=1 Tax=Methanoregula sp. TaxID=2052170 RepID=UPI003C145DF0
MYPDRATFGKIVDAEPDLSAAGRETLLVLYDGPLKLPQILLRVNAQEKQGSGAKKGHSISESALRKRLEVLIGQGIIGRAGNERTNPYYFIRRSWLFNRYILVRCRENPAGGLIDLKILLGEISRHTPEGRPDVVQPRVISAIGERTERSHEVEAAYEAFRQRLGEPEAIGDYLEGIYADIFEGKVPSSDIDGSLARDFLRFVATASPEEHEIRFFFWYAQFFQTLDLYEASAATFERGIGLARQQGLDPDAILAEARISRGSILLHLNDLAGAKEAFLSDARRNGAGPFAQAKNLFGAGEVELACGATGPALAPARFSRALERAAVADPEHRNPDVEEIRGDTWRRSGTLYRITGQYDKARECYEMADTIYHDDMFRGRVRLLPEQAELMRAYAFSSSGGAAGPYLTRAAGLYEEAKTAAQRIRSISRFAHVLIGECELARIASQKFRRPLPKDLDAKYSNAFEICCQISSKWGMAQCFISESLLYPSVADEFPDKYADTADKLVQAEAYCRELGLAAELALIRRIKVHADPAAELNPLTFL